MKSPSLRLAAMAFAAVSLTVGAYALMNSPRVPDGGDEVTDGGAADAASIASDGAVDSGPPSPPDPILGPIDESIAAAEARAAARDDDWIHLEIAGNRYIDRARASGDWEDFGKAGDAFRRAYGRAPDGAGPHLAQAALDYAMHRLPEASTALDALEAQAVVPIGSRATIAQLRADIAFHSGRYDDAKASYEALLEEQRTASLLVAYAQWHWKTGDPASARPLLDEAVTAASSASPGTRAWVYLVRGLFGLEHGAYEDALLEYRHGLAETPESWLHEEHIAEILVLEGRPSQASAIYERVIERTGNPELMDALAGLLREAGDAGDAGAAERADALVAQARAGWEARLALFPEAAYGHAIGHWLELEDDPRRTVELAEANAVARPNGESKTLLAEAYLAADRAEDAQRTIEEVLESAWDTADCHAVAARVYAALGDEEQASVNRERAQGLNPHALD